MSIRENMTVPVYNYNNSYVYAVSNIQTYEFIPAKDGIPTVCYISFPEIVYINSISDCFRTGLLMFSEEMQEEVYKEIQFADWKSIITNQQIKNILLNPTKEGLEKLIAITNESIFNRVKSVLVELKNSNADDVSNRVIKVIDTRWNEIRRGVFKSQIHINFKNDNISNDTQKAELENVKSQNAMLLDQIAEMKKMIEQLSNKETTSEVTPAEATEGNNTTKEEPKRVGRPPKNK